MEVQNLVNLFKSKGRTLGSVESFTGGLFAAKITSIPGASHFYKGGLVTYSNEEKVRLLGVPYDEIDKFGVISEQMASIMVMRAAKILRTDYCVSFTGNAGPTALENKPVGTIFIGFYYYNKISVYRFNLKGTRNEIREQAIALAIKILKDLLIANN
ncbi:MAG: CinA family protein [Erysipelotrichia bacterium]|jgi:PncC family amidohydrolase|nr:CinA family protein [Bacilli bacterium]NLB49681.1 CinA family protein [Erysipelotrichia bacterium]